MTKTRDREDRVAGLRDSYTECKSIGAAATGENTEGITTSTCQHLDREECGIEKTADAGG